MLHRLVRLSGDEDWEEIGEQWETLEHITDLQFVTGWLGPPDWMRDHEHHALDWGAVLWEASKPDLLRLTTDWRPDHEVFHEARQKQDALLSSLPHDGRYGVIWIELA